MDARLPRRILGYATAQGLDSGRLLTRAGLEGGALERPDARIPLRACYLLVESIARELADPGFATGVVASITIEDFGGLGYLMMTSANVRESYTRFVDFQRLLSDGERYTVTFGADRVVLGYEPHGAPRLAHRLLAEMAFVDIVQNGERMLGRPLPVVEARFLNPEPVRSDALREGIGAPLVWGAGAYELVIADHVLDWPMPDANATLAAFFEGYSREQLARLPEPDARARTLGDDARVWIGERLLGGSPSLDALAEHLGMSTRTLQRRLKSEGATFHGLVDDVRHARALAFIGNGLAIAEVAYLLGYSEASAFHRAFKRWTGRPPEAFRSR